MSKNSEIRRLDSSLFNIDIPTRQPRAGAILVAEPFLREEYFNHSVISLIECEKGESAMGLVLNKPTGYTLGEAIHGIDEEVEIPVYCGGPLSHDRLFYLHSLGDEFEGARQIAPGLFIGGDFEQVCSYINMGLETEGKIRFFIGYSGWDPNQLESEVQNHVWAVSTKVDVHDILREEGESAWYKFVRSLGRRYRNWLYYPVNPHFN